MTTNTLIAIMSVVCFLGFAAGWFARGQEQKDLDEPNESEVKPL